VHVMERGLVPLRNVISTEGRSFLADFRRLRTTFQWSSDEKRLQESLEFMYGIIRRTVLQSRYVQLIKARLAEGTLRKKIQAAIQRLKAALSGEGGSGFREKLAGFKASLAQTYDRVAKRWYLKLSAFASGFRMRLADWLRRRWHTVYFNYRTHFFSAFYSLETTIKQTIENVKGMIQEIKSRLQSSPNLQYLKMQLSGIQDFMKTVLRQSLRENLNQFIEGVRNLVIDTVKFFVYEVAPFMEDWWGEVKEAWNNLLQYRPVRRLKERVLVLVDTMVWAYKSFDIKEKLFDWTVFLVENGRRIYSQTALQAQHRQRQAKTSLHLDVPNGVMSLTQKLPVTWLDFASKPLWHEIHELKTYYRVRNFFFGESSGSILDFWYKYFSLTPDYTTWLPPFDGYAAVVKGTHLLTWNGQTVHWKGLCSHLLVGDVVGRAWAVVLNYRQGAQNGYTVYLGHRKIEMDRDYSVKLDGVESVLPVVLDGSVVYRKGAELRLDHLGAFSITWNQLHDVFSVHLKGKYFGKVGGMFGNFNFEARDDQMLPSGKLASSAQEFTHSWMVSRACLPTANLAVTEQPKHSEACRMMFDEKTSPYKYCFYQIVKSPYQRICNFDNHCSVASSMRQSCEVAHVPTKVPHDCNSCPVTTRSDPTPQMVMESQSVVLGVEELPQSTDVVIIVELGDCNRNSVLRRNLAGFLKKFDETLNQQQLFNNRYAVVSYGGGGFYGRPQILTRGPQIFRAVDAVQPVLEASIAASALWPASGAPVDGFEAIRFALALPFKAGTSPTLLLLPCSPCLPNVGALDFGTMYHILVDRGAVLHILYQKEFKTHKNSLRGRVLGLDALTTYSLRDAVSDQLEGNPLIRKEVEEHRDQLYLCSPLALQANGTIFNNVLLTGTRRRRRDQMTVVLGRRVAAGATPLHPQRCQCLPGPDDAARMRCHNSVTPRAYDADPGLSMDMDGTIGDEYYEDNYSEDVDW